MVTKVYALETYDLRALLKYLEHAPHTSRDFLEISEVKVITQILLKYPTILLKYHKKFLA